MNRPSLSFIAIALTTLGCLQTALSQTSPPFTAEEREAVYTTTIDKRARGVMEQLTLSNDAKSNTVHQVIMAQYRALRARDAAVDGMLQALEKDMPGVESNRQAVVALLTKRLHDGFLTSLAKNLSPAQIEIVKDKMTYGKVKVTYDAYCEIVPGLSDQEKVMILETLKLAREEAIDGGSADEKSTVFQKYKDRINDRLSAGGHDVAKATQEWEAKQAAAKPASSAK